LTVPGPEVRKELVLEIFESEGLLNLGFAGTTIGLWLGLCGGF
jgi:hypothetical protein